MLAAALAIGSLTLVHAAADTTSEKYWPQWRGPHATGVSKTADPPVEWSETKNIRWKVEIPGRGSGTPVVWGDKVFVLSAVPVGVEPAAAHAAARRQPARASRTSSSIMALDRKTGKVALGEDRARARRRMKGAHQQFGHLRLLVRVHRRRARLRLLRLVRALRLRHERQAALGEGPRRQEDAQRVRRGADARAPRQPDRRPVGSPGPVVHHRARQADRQGAVADGPAGDRQLGHAAGRRARRRRAGDRGRDEQGHQLRPRDRQDRVGGSGADDEPDPVVGATRMASSIAMSADSAATGCTRSASPTRRGTSARPAPIMVARRTTRRTCRHRSSTTASSTS